MSKTKIAIGLSGLIMLCVFPLACGSNESVLLSGKETPGQANDANQISDFATDLDAMRTAGFTFVFVLRRKDGGTMDAEDVGVIKLQTADTNRRVKTDDDRVVMIGSNKEIPKENLDVLYARFIIENHSLPPVVDTNTNTNPIRIGV